MILVLFELARAKCSRRVLSAMYVIATLYFVMLYVFEGDVMMINCLCKLLILFKIEFVL